MDTAASSVSSIADQTTMPSQQDSSTSKAWDDPDDPMQNQPESLDDPDSVANRETLCPEAVAMVLYNERTPDPNANDIWPNFRSATRLPAQYVLLKQNNDQPSKSHQQGNDPQPPAHGGQCYLDDDDEDRIEQGSFITGWPVSQIPLELFRMIAEYLDRDDIKSMRLVCNEFDRNLSPILFNSIVVPFNAELYGMYCPANSDVKGKGKDGVGSLFWSNANEGDLYTGHGLDVFRGFGKYIQKFGMSFDVNEDLLANLPPNHATETITRFWGGDEWPIHQRHCFPEIANLESVAHEKNRMKKAFSELSKVEELALSLDSGLGWLSGADRSIRARILPKQAVMFGRAFQPPDRRERAQQDLWNLFKSRHEYAESDIRLASLYKTDNYRSFDDLEGISVMDDDPPRISFFNLQLAYEAVPRSVECVPLSEQEQSQPSDISQERAVSRNDSRFPYRFPHWMPASKGSSDAPLHESTVPQAHRDTGILFSAPWSSPDSRARERLVPSQLTSSQAQWLYEIELAQRAFLSSWMLSIIDNRPIFKSIHTLRLCKIPDYLLHYIDHRDFWNALPSLRSVSLHVVPRWRETHYVRLGCAYTSKVSPFHAMIPFYNILQNISLLRNVKKLSIGWVTGGEHAEGVYARNKLVLPSPLVPADGTFVQGETPTDLTFPHLEELTMNNCWMMPLALIGLVERHDGLRLKSLVLDSFSLALTPNTETFGEVWQLYTCGLGHATIASTITAMPGFRFPHPDHHDGEVSTRHAPFMSFDVMISTLRNQILQLGNIAGQSGSLSDLYSSLERQVKWIQEQQSLFNSESHRPDTSEEELEEWENAMPGDVSPMDVLQFEWRQHLKRAQELNKSHVEAALHSLPLPAGVGSPASAILTEPPVPDSWLYVLDIISPGVNLKDFDPTHSSTDPRRKTHLHSLKLNSCGYVVLPEMDRDPPQSEFFSAKYLALIHSMQQDDDPHFGKIVQFVNLGELGALEKIWNLKTGWEDEEAARAVGFDGWLDGGTGRFTGVIEKGHGENDEETNDSTDEESMEDSEDDEFIEDGD